MPPLIAALGAAGTAAMGAVGSAASAMGGAMSGAMGGATGGAMGGATGGALGGATGGALGGATGGALGAGATSGVTVGGVGSAVGGASPGISGLSGFAPGAGVPSGGAVANIPGMAAPSGYSGMMTSGKAVLSKPLGGGGAGGPLGGGTMGMPSSVSKALARMNQAPTGTLPGSEGLTHQPKIPAGAGDFVKPAPSALEKFTPQATLENANTAYRSSALNPGEGTGPRTPQPMASQAGYQRANAPFRPSDLNPASAPPEAALNLTPEIGTPQGTLEAANRPFRASALEAGQPARAPSSGNPAAPEVAARAADGPHYPDRSTMPKRDAGIEDLYEDFDTTTQERLDERAADYSRIENLSGSNTVRVNQPGQRGLSGNMEPNTPDPVMADAGDAAGGKQDFTTWESFQNLMIGRGSENLKPGQRSSEFKHTLFDMAKDEIFKTSSGSSRTRAADRQASDRDADYQGWLDQEMAEAKKANNQGRIDSLRREKAGRSSYGMGTTATQARAAIGHDVASSALGAMDEFGRAGEKGMESQLFKDARRVLPGETKETYRQRMEDTGIYPSSRAQSGSQVPDGKIGDRQKIDGKDARFTAHGWMYQMDPPSEKYPKGRWGTIY